MFNIPEKYKVDKKFSTRIFIKKYFKPVEKKKLNESLESIILRYQIKGEDIPSLVNDNYNVQVICFFDIKIDDIKNASFVSGILQNMIKSLCVMHFYDDSYETYSFAYKRLNLQDESQIVILDLLLLNNMPVMLMDDKKTEYNNFLNFYNIKNKNDKLSFYMELYVKSYIISNDKLYSGVKKFLNCSIWYNLNDVINMYKKLRSIENLKSQMKKSYLNSEKMKINSKLKLLIDELKKIQGGLSYGI